MYTPRPLGFGEKLTHEIRVRVREAGGTVSVLSLWGGNKTGKT